MIDKIVLDNFQRHEHKVIVLDPHVTTIVGPNDHGKSTILRALRWLVTNRPLDVKEYIRWGEDGLEVKLFLDGGKRIRRAKTPSGNTYQIDKGEKHRAVGAQVPDEVARLLNLSQASFQLQHDAIWWFKLPASQISKELNQIVDLSLIDTVLGHAATEVRGKRAAIVVVKERLRTAKDRVEKYQWVEDVDDRLAKLERQKKDLAALETRAAQLSTAIRKAERLAVRRDRAEEAAKQGAVAAAAGALACNLTRRAAALGELIAECEQAERAAMIPRLNGSILKRLFETWQKTTSKSTELGNLLHEIQSLQTKKTETKRMIAAEAKRLIAIKAALTRCPTCGAPLGGTPLS